MKIVEADGFEFRFEDALDAFVFDETDSSKHSFHGVPMKGVDIVAEFEEAYVYVEMKDYYDSSIYDVLGAATDEERKLRQKSFKWLKNYLKYKFRDSYLYRYAEQKVEKPVHYVCLLTFDNALNSRMQKSLKRELPVGKASRRWVLALAKSCQVVNVDKWNENFPKWPVTRLADAAAGGA
ncbi:hypothetical protein DO021_19055 [Desulfobacter hydrogenophilus]|uniref:Uncharacterized protein n=1 Tax=Desulfobacter hydrogenophilus TaxID=2291 RepID=A0A328F7S3_9BACT|nr:hypothetical protein [Desulfobacter hydrogenophilus]NDY73875.1 hypothetical protein [Desulfobacter hydrogenophilus]QBH14730.1 hypothetical protein EYB58_18500 [Desulfobacter hydrogenophilus]RAM00429.1 hypothetical protein DO021_19055 [Desulfobacter hydrogenophilus]